VTLPLFPDIEPDPEPTELPADDIPRRAGSADSGTPDDQSGGGGASPTPALPKAHQRVIREQRATEDSDVDLFGRWWEGVDLSPNKCRVREISYQTAEKVILDYEWLARMPAITSHHFGIYFDGHLGGVAVYAPEYAENLGVWDTYGFTGKIILLARGACVHWAPPYAASKLTRWSMRLLPARFEVVTATVDAIAGEVGTIYQACGFDYVGRMSRSSRTSFKVCGRDVSERRVRGKYGVGAPGLERVRSETKGRYFAFRGPYAPERRQAIAHLIKPYPKRRAGALRGSGP